MEPHGNDDADVTEQRRELARLGVVAIDGTARWTAHELGVLITVYTAITGPKTDRLRGLVVVRDNQHPKKASPRDVIPLETHASTHCLALMHTHFYDDAFNRVPPERVVRVLILALTREWLNRNRNVSIDAARQQFAKATANVLTALDSMEKHSRRWKSAGLIVRDVSNTFKQIKNAIELRQQALYETVEALAGKVKDIGSIKSICEHAGKIHKEQQAVLAEQLSNMDQHIQDIRRIMHEQGRRKSGSTFLNSWKIYEPARETYLRTLNRWVKPRMVLYDFILMAAKSESLPNVRPTASVEAWYLVTYTLAKTGAISVPDAVKKWFTDVPLHRRTSPVTSPQPQPSAETIARLASLGVVAINGTAQWTERELDTLVQAYSTITGPDTNMLHGLVVIRDHLHVDDHDKPQASVQGVTHPFEPETHPVRYCLRHIHIHFYDRAFYRPREKVQAAKVDNKPIWDETEAPSVPIHELAHALLHRNNRTSLMAGLPAFDDAYRELVAATDAVRKILDGRATWPFQDINETFKQLAAAIRTRHEALLRIDSTLAIEGVVLLPMMVGICKTGFDAYQKQTRIAYDKLLEMREHTLSLKRFLGSAPNSVGKEVGIKYLKAWRRYLPAATRYVWALRYWLEARRALYRFVRLAAEHDLKLFNERTKENVEEWFCETYALVRLTESNPVPDPIKKWFRAGLSRSRRPRN